MLGWSITVNLLLLLITCKTGAVFPLNHERVDDWHHVSLLMLAALMVIIAFIKRDGMKLLYAPVRCHFHEASLA